MHFGGIIYFDFATYDVWRIYTILLRASQARGVTIGVDWRAFNAEEIDGEAPIPSSTRALAACELVRRVYGNKHNKFVRALLTLAYQEKDDPGDDRILEAAARVAEIDRDGLLPRVLEPGLEFLESTSAEARKSGVTQVPTIVRQGPPVYVKTTGAATHGDAVARLELINLMLADDGIWTLSKP